MMFRGNPKERQRKIFLELIEKHERQWGSSKYTGRPTLSQIMEANVVAAWYPTDPTDNRYTLTLHPDLKSINAYVKALVLYSQQGKLPHSWLWRVFAKQTEIKILDVGIKWESTEPKPVAKPEPPKPPTA